MTFPRRGPAEAEGETKTPTPSKEETLQVEDLGVRSTPGRPAREGHVQQKGYDQLGITHVSHRHDAIIDWLIMNPTRSLGECAKELEISRGWLSLVIRSDAFQARYEERRSEVVTPVMQTLYEKMQALAHESVERQHKLVSEGKADDPAILNKVIDTTLSKLGYGTQKGGPGGGAQTNFVQNNYYTQPVDRGRLEQARARMHQAHSGQLIEGGQE